MTNENMKHLAVRALQDDAFNECGWLSDAQGAQLGIFGESVAFCGEGSIDLDHMVGIVLGVLESIAQVDEVKLARVIRDSYANEQGLKIRDDLRTADAVVEWLRGGAQ